MIKKLDHVNILSINFEETRRFYKEIFGMTETPSPGGNAENSAWLYDCDSNPVLHVQRVDPEDPEKIFARVHRRLGGLKYPDSMAMLDGTGLIEHVAFECDGYEQILNKLTTHGLRIRTDDIPSMGLRQIFVNDPNGILLELNFRGS